MVPFDYPAKTSMTEFSKDLAALRIEREDRSGGGRNWTGPIVTLAVLVLLAGGGLWYWSTVVQAASVKVAPVTAKAGGPSAPGTVLNASGYVVARRRATVSSKVTGKVMDVLIEEGHPVKAGQVLAHLDDSQARAALNLADAQLAASKKSMAEDEAKLAQEELTLKRRESLLNDKVVGQAEVDDARSVVDSTKARIEFSRQQISVAERSVELQKTNLDDMVVRAPFSGVVISKDAQPGEMISPVSAGGGFTRTGIGTIVDMGSLEIEVDVNETYINRVTPNQRVEAMLDAYPDWRIPAHVITTIPSADRQKATVKVRIAFDGLDPRILPDMGVKVSFLKDAPAPGQAAVAPRVVVPKAAVRSADGHSIVFVLKDDRVERRAVSIGLENGDQVELVSGVSAGERVVVDGPVTLKDGDKVRVQQS
jgi:RND family efflux transporter MFP subunit